MIVADLWASEPLITASRAAPGGEDEPKLQLNQSEALLHMNEDQVARVSDD